MKERHMRERGRDSFQVLKWWDVVGTRDPAWGRIAKNLVTEGTTQAMLNASLKELPKQTAWERVAEYLPYVPAGRVTVPPQQPVTAAQVRAWAAGTEDAPRWVVRVLLHRLAVIESNTNYEDEHVNA